MSSQGRWSLYLVVGLGLLLLLLPAAAGAQCTLKPVPMKALNRVDGHFIYDRECAACHGTDGKGNERAERALEVPVPDLTEIAANDGRYIVIHVVHHFVDPNVHGAAMPEWGRYIPAAYGGDRAAAELAALNVARYIETLQAVHRQ